MFELAITQGLAFIAFSRNAKATTLPDGQTVLGPIPEDELPKVCGDYVIRKVSLVGPEPAPGEIGGTEPPVVEGEVVVVRRIVLPLPEDMALAEAARKRREEIAQELVAIDAASARPLRAIVAGTGTQADRDRLGILEYQAAALRSELATL